MKKLWTFVFLPNQIFFLLMFTGALFYYNFECAIYSMCPTFVNYILGRDDRNDGRGLMGPPGPPGKPGQVGPKGTLILVKQQRCCGFMVSALGSESS